MTDHDRISAYYLGRLNRSRETHEALGWESPEAQQARFSVLLGETPADPYSLLDVGAGLGDLYEFLRLHNEPVDYTGIDILPQMVERARRRFAGGRFECVDILGKQRWQETFDVVFASGIFNLAMPDNLGFVDRGIGRFSKIARRVCVVNFLSDSSPDKEDPYYYYSADRVRPLFERRFRRVEVKDGYLANDFTLVARHER